MRAISNSLCLLASIAGLVLAAVPVDRARGDSGSGASVSLHVEGMTCASCKVAVRTALTKLDGVKGDRVDVANKSATIEYDPTKVTPQQLVDAVNRLGYQASLPANSGS